jgi:hypothetical protein
MEMEGGRLKSSVSTDLISQADGELLLFEDENIEGSLNFENTDRSSKNKKLYRH